MSWAGKNWIFEAVWCRLRGGWEELGGRVHAAAAVIASYSRSGPPGLPCRTSGGAVDWPPSAHFLHPLLTHTVSMHLPLQDILEVEQVIDDNKGLDLTSENVDNVLDEIRCEGCRGGVGIVLDALHAGWPEEGGLVMLRRHPLAVMHGT